MKTSIKYTNERQTEIEIETKREREERASKATNDK